MFKTLILLLLATLALAQSDLDREERAADVQDRFSSDSAMFAREQRFFCLERETGSSSTGASTNITISQFEQDGSNVWTLLFQMPLLGFLDLARKRSLIDIVLNVAGSPLTLNDVCLGTYETYGFTTFTESVLIRLYPNPSNGASWTVSTVHTTFIDNINSNSYVISYPGQSNIRALNLTLSNQFQNIIQPGYPSSDEAIPMNLAVFIGSWPFNVSFAPGNNSNVSRALSSSQIDMSRFAANSNPINYGLEAGDIVFAIIGSILLAAVGFLIVFGYFIHPVFIDK